MGSIYLRRQSHFKLVSVFLGSRGWCVPRQGLLAGKEPSGGAVILGGGGPWRPGGAGRGLDLGCTSGTPHWKGTTEPAVLLRMPGPEAPSKTTTTTAGQ